MPSLAPGGSVQRSQFERAFGSEGSPRKVSSFSAAGPAAVVDAVSPLWGDALQVLQVDGDAHGLHMLEANPGIVETVAGFLDGVLLGSVE